MNEFIEEPLTEPLRIVRHLGSVAVFAGAVGRAAVMPPWRLVALSREIYKSGVLSLIIICVSGGAVGMVLGLQGYHTLVRFGAERSLDALASA